MVPSSILHKKGLVDIFLLSTAKTIYSYLRNSLPVLKVLKLQEKTIRIITF